MLRSRRAQLDRSLVSATLLACGGGASGTHVGGPCESNHACDDGQICDLTAPGGAVCLDASGDVDGDGIANGKDFCEHMAGGDHDEDGDGIGDECDPCPIGPPSAQTEPDGDGVDGLCDPDPTTPGDKIVLFNGFNAQPPSTIATAGWKFQGGEAIMTPTTPGAMEVLSIPLTIPSNHITVLAAYRVDSVTAGTTQADAGVIGINNLPMGTTTAQCGGARLVTGDELLLKTDTTDASKPVDDLFNPASLYRVAEQLDGTAANCVLIGSKQTGTLGGNNSGFAMNRVGIYARDATVRFSYILVVGR